MAYFCHIEGRNVLLGIKNNFFSISLEYGAEKGYNRIAG